MGSKLKRFLAVLLTVLMLVSMVPVSALATESEHDHEHASTATSAPVAPASDSGDPTVGDSEEPDEPEDPDNPGQEGSNPPAAEPGNASDQVCYLPGDANSDGEVHVNDAFYVLYSSLMSGDYPMNHSGDYNADGVIDKDDALLVLKYVHGLAPKPSYTHMYQEPVWNWNCDSEGSVYVSVTFPCSCGNSPSFDSDTHVSWEQVAQQDATCTEDGYVRYSASVEFEGTTYTNEYVHITEARFGHTVSEESVSCEEGATCDRCDYTLEAKGHSWGESVLTEGDCQTAATLTRTCTTCGATESENADIAYAHAWVYVDDIAVADIPCGYVKAYECSVCHTTKSDVEYDENGDPTNVFYKHTYTAALTTEATCQQDGVKTLTCACGHKTTETVPANPEAHVWGEGVKNDATGIITYTCTCDGCTASKTAVDASNSAVPKESLENTNGELTVGDVSISMDTDTVNALTGDVTVNVFVVDESATADLTEEQKGQIGDNPVYDFTLTDGTGNVTSFDGEITISLPYTPQDGDDVDCIDVWFIADNGTVTVQKGTYSNGFVTFTTNHFSYYTVTQLTAKERCEHYGHIWETISKDATCYSNGYSMEKCQRCDAEQNAQNFNMLAHNFVFSEEDSTPATCTTPGMEVKTCSHCGATSRTTLFALGHNMEVTESVAATCTEAGYEIKECANGDCTFTQNVQFSALGHDYQYTDTVAPTCTDKGYDVYTCTRCSDTQHRNEQPATGHDYHEAENAWSWNDELTAATVTLVCSHDESHSTTQKAVVSEVIKAASCTAGGTTTYTAKLTYNNVSYENVQYSQQSATGHATTSEEWQTTSGKHYRTCDSCGVRIEQADHNWGDAEITVAPSCVSAGRATYSCTVCGYSRQEVLPATGIHEDHDSDGACDTCGFREETCTHELTVERLMDLSGYNVCEGTQIIERSCECGKETDYVIDQIACTWGEDVTTYEKELSDGRVMIVNVSTCQDCGAVQESGVNGIPIENTCNYNYVFYSKLIIDGETIYESEKHEIVPMGHDMRITLEEKTITADGFCGAEILIHSCGCGDWIINRSSYNCDWVHVENDDCIEMVCTVCGASRTIAYSQANNNCEFIHYEDYTLEYNGEVLHSVRTHYRWIEHAYELERYVLDDDTCEDGVTITRKCSVCGEIEEYHTTYHETIVSTHTDLTDWGNPCMIGVIQNTCPCGERHRYDTIFDMDSDFSEHSWNVIREEGNTTVYACDNCGYTKTSVSSMSEKDASCEALVQHTDTISDGGDHSVTVYWTETVTDHNILENYTLLGESCEDGVLREGVCQDCGFLEYSDTHYGHVGVAVESFNLREFGGCDAECHVYQCPCGQNAWWGYDEGACDWEEQSYENGSWVYTCAKCGLSRKDNYKHLSTDGCTETHLNTISFLKNGRTVKTISFTNHPTNHRYIYELTLHEGATSCADGYDIKGTCLNCGHTYESNDHYGCETWLTERVVSPDGVLCGNLIVEHYSCACGNQVNATTNRENGECNIIDYVDEETGESIRRCEYCGVEVGETIVEHTTLDPACYYLETRTESYYRDGQCVFTVELRNTFYEHDWIATYQTGEGFDSCDDGYDVYETCSICNETIGYDDSRCTARPVAKTLATSRDDICGDIYRYDNSCACGANSFVTYVMPCNFVEDGIDEATGAQKYRCTDCAMRYDILITSETVPGTTCQMATHRKTNYYVGDELLFSEESDSVNDDHNIVTGFRLLGETCADGYHTQDLCSKCGKVFWENEEVCYDDCYESTYAIDRETIYNTACGTTFAQTNSCACGKNSRTELWSSCDFSEVSSDGNGNEVHRCNNCGIEKRITRSEELVEGTTCDYLITWTNQFFQGEELLGTYVSTENETRHTEEYHFDLLGKDCDDGYYVSTVCSKCGEALWSNEEVRYGCSSYDTWDYSTPYFEDAGACGTYYKVTSTCACGKHQSIRLECEDWRCEMEYIDEIDGESIYQCIHCGLTKKSKHISDTEDRANCLASDEYLHTYSINGVQIGQFQSSSQWGSHTWLHTYELYGETCREGYTETMTCYFCQKQNTHERVPSEDEPEFECWTNLVALEPVVERDDICSNVYFATERCACGNQEFTHWFSDCNFGDEIYNEETNEWYAQCSDCGLVRRYNSETVYNPEACTASDLTHYTFYMNGTECGTYTSEYVREHHFTTATFDMQGDSCEDGYYVTHTCRYCDYSRTEEELRTDHNTYETTVHDLADLGCDGVKITETACPCGHRLSYSMSDSCSFEWTEETNPDGHNFYTCNTCGLQYVHYATDYTEDIANCTYSNNQNFRFYRNGELLQTVVIPYRDSTHNYVMTDVALNDSELGCEGGYTVTMQCPFCLDAYTHTAEAGDAWHEERNTDIFYVELEGGCHTVYQISSCPCGKHTSCGYYYDSCDYEYSNETVTIGSISHNISTRICTVCGFTVIEDSYDQPTEDPCKVITTLEVTCRYGDKVMTHVESRENSNHDLQVTGAELLEGNANCEQGVMVTYSCTRCDHTESSEQWGHFTYVDEAYALEEYGSVHGGELAHFLCACGSVSRYDFRNMTCDLDRQEIENFIDGALNEEWSETADGGTWIDSEAYLIKCAVTDPQCGLTVRMSEYWLVDEATCIATEYQVWQLGYDEATGEYEKEILIPTGETAAYHNYEHTTNSETDAEGNNVIEHQYLCSCGSSRYEKQVLYADGRQRNWWDAVNALNDGKTRERHSYRYYDRVVNDYSYETEYYEEYIDANGETHWSKQVRTYDSEDLCYYTCVHTGSHEEEWSHNDWSHANSHIWITEPTCSQPGQYYYECAACGAIDQTYDCEPNGHYWYYDDSLGCYRCSSCDLKNSNGADGNIVMEDLSDEEFYIVGYWVREEMAFDPRAAVVKYNTESGEEEVILLDGIDYTTMTKAVDGINAISMDKAQVDAAVAAQLDGYEGGYAVRVIFVPSNDQSIMDYALIFDTCYTEGWEDPEEIVSPEFPEEPAA